MENLSTKSHIRDFCFIVIFIINFLPASLSHAEHNGSFSQESIVWRSGVTHEEAIPLEIERLYLTLYNTRNLQVRKYGRDAGRNIESILREEKLFFGSYFPIGIDSVLCDLNNHVCKRKRIPANTNLMKLYTHVGGYEKSAGNWKNHSGSTLYLPVIEFDNYIDFRLTDKKAGKSADDIVSEQAISCEETYGTSCQEMVKSLNAHTPDVLQTEAEGKAILPYQRITAKIELNQTSENNTDISLTPKNLPFDQKWLDIIRAEEEKDKITHKSLKRNVVGGTDIKTQAVHNQEPLYSKQKKLFELISHPYAGTEKLAEPFRQDVRVGVLDGWIDLNHCDLKSSIKRHNVSNQPQPGTTTTCGEQKDTLSVVKDHGTHVTGLISANLNGKGIIGLDPFATIDYHVVDKDKFRNPQLSQNEALAIVPSMLNSRVINISWQYVNSFGGDDSLKNVIRDVLGGKLFVAAAGNDKQELSDGCGLRPACFELPNVITVAGLDRNESPNLWTNDAVGSNYGKYVHIAAIAENVLSTTSSNTVGIWSGTSMAVPQVSAAAALLVSDHQYQQKDHTPTLHPQQIKNRLMYTADLYQHLLNKVYSGRLNVKRALDVEQDVFVIKDKNDPTKTEEISGLVVSFLQMGYTPETCTNANSSTCRTTEVQCAIRNSETIKIPIKSIRRMQKLGNHYVIFYNKEPNNSASKLERVTKCNMITLSNKAYVNTGDNIVNFELGQIQNYISSMY